MLRFILKVGFQLIPLVSSWIHKDIGYLSNNLLAVALSYKLSYLVDWGSRKELELCFSGSFIRSSTLNPHLTCPLA